MIEILLFLGIVVVLVSAFLICERLKDIATAIGEQNVLLAEDDDDGDEWKRLLK